jgi:RNA 2',3'-cyclic 3'-phosphodiesterase
MTQHYAASGGKYEMKNYKLLIVIDPTPVEKQALACISQELRMQFKGGRPNPWELYHITLHFFEEMPEDRIQAIKRAMKKAAQGQQQFTLVTGKPGIFGTEDSAVVWVGISDGTNELSQLHTRLEKQLEKAGFLEENRPYQPHITLGRELDTTKFSPALKDTLLASVNLSAHALTLLESKKVDGKLVYEQLAKFEFSQPK